MSGTSTTTTPVPAPRAPATDRARTTWLRLLRSELLRFRTVRANVVTLAALALVMVTIGLVAAATSTGEVDGVGPGGQAPGFSGTDPLTIVLAGQTPGVLIIGVLGVLVGAREYGSGLIRTTMAAVPRRWPVLLARVGVFVGVALPVALAATLLAYAGGTAVLSAADAEVAAWSDPGVPRAVVGTALYLVAVGVLGVCLGVLTRSVGQGIGWLVGLVIVVPGFGSLLLPDDWDGVLDVLPSSAGTSLATPTDPEGLGVGAGALVLAGWVVAAVLAAAAALRARDV